MALLQSLVEGVTSAMSPDVARENEQKRFEQRSDRRATSQEELHAQTKMILDNVQGVKDKIAALGQNPNPQQLAPYQAQLHQLRQQFQDLYHPAKNPGHLSMLGKILGSIRGEQPQQAVNVDRMVQGDIAGAGVPPQAKTPKLSDYATSLRRFVEGEGGDPDNPTAAQEAEFRKTRERKAGPKERIVPDPESTTGYAAEGYDAEGKQLYRVQNVVPPRSAIASETTTKDPFGVTSTSTRRPIFPGAKQPAGGAQSPAPKKPGEMKKELDGKVSKGQKTGTPQVDASGHVPVDAKVNPQLREAANNLLDGMDVDKLPIPQRDRAAAQELAEKYGWKGQGLFTPKDQLLLRESETYLNHALKDPSLKVLDSATSRLKLMNALADNPGIASDVLASTWKLNDNEAGFLAMYRQLIGTISGLGQLTRANRTTEAGIKRLMAELPNPREVQTSGQAKTRINRLISELRVARDKGYIPTTFEGDEGEGDVNAIVKALNKGK